MIDGRIAAAKTAVGSTLYERADARADEARQLEDVAARLGVAVAGGDRRAERDERARPVADGVAHHLGQLARERPLPLLHALPREDVILEHEVVGDGGRDDHEVRARSALSAAWISPVFAGFSSPL